MSAAPSSVGNSGDMNMDSVYREALAYDKGLGVTPDFVKACELYRQAADGGNMLAVCGLGCMHEYGRGVDPDYAKAFDLYTRAANSGEVAGFFNLSFMYASGRGVPKNIVKARQLRQRAADGGHRQAALHLPNLDLQHNPDG